MVKTEKILEDIVKGCIKNNRSDQEAFFNKFAGRFMAVAQRVSPNDNIANDILQDSFIKIFKKLSTLKTYDEPAIYSWGKKLISNVAIDFYRKEKRYSKDFEQLDDEVNIKNLSIYDKDDIGSVNEYGCWNDDGDESTYLEAKNISPDMIIKSIQKLSPQYKLVFNMFVMDGLTHDEIAETLNITTGTSKSNLSKAKERLREDLTLCN